MQSVLLFVAEVNAPSQNLLDGDIIIFGKSAPAWSGCLLFSTKFLATDRYWYYSAIVQNISPVDHRSLYTKKGSIIVGSCGVSLVPLATSCSCNLNVTVMWVFWSTKYSMLQVLVKFWNENYVSATDRPVLSCNITETRSRGGQEIHILCSWNKQSHTGFHPKTYKPTPRVISRYKNKQHQHQYQYRFLFFWSIT